MRCQLVSYLTCLSNLPIARGLQNGIDESQWTKTVVSEGGTLLVFKLR